MTFDNFKHKIPVALIFMLSSAVVISFFILWPRGTVYPAAPAFRAQIEVSQLLNATHSFHSVATNQVKPISKMERISEDLAVGADVAHEIERILRQFNCEMWNATPTEGDSEEGEHYVLIRQIGATEGGSAAMYKKVNPQSAR